MSNNIVYLASYPKSGNTWLRTIIVKALTNSSDINALHQFIPSFNALLQNKYGLDKNIPIDKVFEKWEELQSFIGNEPKRTILKTHNACGKFKNSYFPLEQCTYKVIYVVRDPRDILISWSKHRNVTLEIIEKDMMNEEYCAIDSDKASYSTEFLSSWDNHVNGWLRCKSPTLMIRYEDLISNFEKQISAIFGFLNIKPVCSIEDIVKATNINSLRKQEQKEGFVEKRHGKYFFGEGKSKGWMNYDFDFRRIEQRFMPLLKQLNYPIY